MNLPLDGFSCHKKNTPFPSSEVENDFCGCIIDGIAQSIKYIALVIFFDSCHNNAKFCESLTNMPLLYLCRRSLWKQQHDTVSSRRGSSGYVSFEFTGISVSGIVSWSLWSCDIPPHVWIVLSSTGTVFDTRLPVWLCDLCDLHVHILGIWNCTRTTSTLYLFCPYAQPMCYFFYTSATCYIYTVMVISQSFCGR